MATAFISCGMASVSVTAQHPWRKSAVSPKFAWAACGPISQRSLEALDVRAWAGATGARQAVLRQKARVLVEACGLAFDWGSWLCALREVERCRHKRSDRDTADDRVLWATASAAGQGGALAVVPFGKLVAFYLGLQDGTGSIERFLGAHAAFLAYHRGRPDTEMCAI